MVGGVFCDYQCPPQAVSGAKSSVGARGSSSSANPRSATSTVDDVGVHRPRSSAHPSLGPDVGASRSVWQASDLPLASPPNDLDPATSRHARRSDVDGFGRPEEASSRVLPIATPRCSPERFSVPSSDGGMADAPGSAGCGLRTPMRVLQSDLGVGPAGHVPRVGVGVGRTEPGWGWFRPPRRS